MPYLDALKTHDAIRSGLAVMGDLTYDEIEGDGLPLRPDVAHYILEDLLAPGSRAFDLTGVADCQLVMEMHGDGTILLGFATPLKSVQFRVLCAGVVWADRTYADGATKIIERLPNDEPGRNEAVDVIRAWLQEKERRR